MQFYQVQLRPVAFVLAETIFRETRAEVAHNRVARDLRDDAGRGDAQTVAITIDDGRLRQGKGENRKAIDEHVFRLAGQRLERRPHGFVGRAQNIDLVDLHGVDHSHGPEDGAVRRQVVVNLLPFFRQELLRIVQLPVPEFFGKNYSGGYHRAGQGAAARFINAGDAGDTECAKFAFMPEAATTVHATTP